MHLNKALEDIREFIESFNSDYHNTELTIEDVDADNHRIDLVLESNKQYDIPVNFKCGLHIEMYEGSFKELSKESVFEYCFFDADARLEKGWTT